MRKYCDLVITVIQLSILYCSRLLLTNWEYGVGIFNEFLDLVNESHEDNTNNIFEEW